MQNIDYQIIILSKIITINLQRNFYSNKYFNNPIIKNLRKKDILKNIKFQTFSDNIKVIDTYYPGTYYDSTTNHIGMDTYGLRYKYDENIYFINKDTFKMSGSSGEEKGKHTYVKHLYVRKK